MAKGEKKPRPGVEFTPEVYRAAAVDRAGALRRLYDGREYGLAIYVSGVAVESILRAYRARLDPEFSARHDLYELAREARFAEVVPESLREQYAADLGVVAARWSNAHRYRSEAAMRKYIKRFGLEQAIKGTL